MSKFFSLYGKLLVTAIIQHLSYVLISVSIGCIIALILGVFLSRFRKLSAVIMPLLSVFQTIPGIVFIGILFLYIGMRPLTIIIALSVYAIFPVLKNTYTGLVEVPLHYIEAARGCGMTSLQSLFKVEISLALPSIFAGVRMSVIYITSWAVLASMIGQGGLGDFVYTGVATNNSTLIIAGAIPSALMAVSLAKLIDYVKGRVIPKGMRGDSI